MNKVLKYSALVGINILYALVTLFTKSASMHPFLSEQYMACLFGAVTILGGYAICWQQILKRIPLSDAYMFKGTSLIFVLFLSVLVFGEGITINNIIGTTIIVIGITLYAKVA